MERRLQFVNVADLLADLATFGSTGDTLPTLWPNIAAHARAHGVIVGSCCVFWVRPSPLARFATIYPLWLYIRDMCTDCGGQMPIREGNSAVS